MTTTQTVHHYFTGPMMELTIEPNIVLTFGRSRELPLAVAIVTRIDGKIASYVTLPKDEFLRAAEVVRSLL